MSILRERMIQDMQLRGFSPRTQQSYARAVRKLAQHYHKSPNLVTDEELRQYFLCRTNVSRWSRVECTIALCGIKFFYEQTLKRDWTTMVYTQLTEPALKPTTDIINRLMADL